MDSTLEIIRKFLKEDELSEEGMNFIKSCSMEVLSAIVPKLLSKEAEKVVNFRNTLRFQEEAVPEKAKLKKEARVTHVQRIEDKDSFIDISKLKHSEQKEKPATEKNREAAFIGQPMLGITKQLMFLYGDSFYCNFEAVKEMKSVVKEVSDKVLKCEKAKTLIGGARDHRSKLPIIRKSLKTYLEHIFPEHWEVFKESRQIVKKINISREREDESAIAKLGDKSLNDELDCVSGYLFSAQYLKQKEERANFYSKRDEQMTPEEANALFELQKKKINYFKLGKEAFVEFIETRVEFLSEEILNFLSYCYCKTVQNTVENCIRSRNGGRLAYIQTALSPEEIKESSRPILRVIETRIRSWGKKSPTLEDLAFNLFKREFYEMEYNVLFQNKEKRGPEAAQAPLDKESEIMTCWKKNMKPYREKWIQRVMAEIKIRNLLKKNLSYSVDENFFANEYGEYLWGQFAKEKMKNAAGSELDVANFVDKFSGKIFKRWLFNDLHNTEDKPLFPEPPRKKPKAFDGLRKDKPLKNIFE